MVTGLSANGSDKKTKTKTKTRLEEVDGGRHHGGGLTGLSFRGEVDHLLIFLLLKRVFGLSRGLD